VAENWNCPTAFDVTPLCWVLAKPVKQFIGNTEKFIYELRKTMLYY
jgi:hypothetical protein